GTHPREYPPRQRSPVSARIVRRSRRRARAGRTECRRHRNIPRESGERSDGSRPFVDGYLPELNEHSEERFRVKKSGLAVLREVESIDDTHVRSLEGRQSRIEVLDVDRQVVHSRTAPCQEAWEKTIGASGFHQFDTVVADAHGHQAEGP